MTIHLDYLGLDQVIFKLLLFIFIKRKIFVKNPEITVSLKLINYFFFILWQLLIAYYYNKSRTLFMFYGSVSIACKVGERSNKFIIQFQENTLVVNYNL